MNRIHSTILAAAAAATLALAGNSHAAISFGDASPTKGNANTDFIPGSGIPENQFTIDTAGTGESVALKARDRATGVPIAQVGNRYFVSQGNDPSNVNRSAWQFEFQFSPGQVPTRAPGDYTYVVESDMNPAFGAATFTSTIVPPSVQGVPMGDSYYPNGTGGSISAGPTYSYNGPWSDAITPFVIANSQNYKFGHLAGAGFANVGPAEYEIRFTAYDANNAAVASTTIFAEVVPEPASLGLVAVGGLALLSRRRGTRTASM